MTSSSQHNSFFLFSEGGRGGSGEGVVIFIYGKGMLIKYQMYRFAHTPLCVGDASRFYRTRRSIQRKTPFFPSLRALLSLSMAMAMIMSSLTADIDGKKVMKMRQSDAADGTLLAEGWELPTRSVFLFCIVFFLSYVRACLPHCGRGQKSTSTWYVCLWLAKFDNFLGASNFDTIFYFF